MYSNICSLSKLKWEKATTIGKVIKCVTEDRFEHYDTLSITHI